MRRALLMVAMLGLAQYAAAAGNFGHMLLKHHKAPPPPPVVVSGPRQCQTVVELAQADGNFTALLAAAQAAGLDKTLADPELSGTLFAPTDDAFAGLLKELKLSAEELLAQTELLTKVLSYHFVPEVIPTAAMYDGQKLPTLLSANVTAPHIYAQEAAMLFVNKQAVYTKRPISRTTEVSIIPSGGAPAEIIKPDVPACKVLVNVVDAVLVPDLKPEKPKVKIVGVSSGVVGHYGH